MMDIKRYIKAFTNNFKILTGTIILCPKCKSPKISHGKSKIDGAYEIYPVKCRNCNITGVICENWEYEQEDTNA